MTRTRRELLKRIRDRVWNYCPLGVALLWASKGEVCRPQPGPSYAAKVLGIADDAAHDIAATFDHAHQEPGLLGESMRKLIASGALRQARMLTVCEFRWIGGES